MKGADGKRRKRGMERERRKERGRERKLKAVSKSDTTLLNNNHNQMAIIADEI